MKAAEIQVMNLDHLGLVAGIIDEIELVEQIDQLLGQDRREKISAGLVVKAMILNGLGFVSAPLYLFSRFFEGKATEHLLGEGVKPSHLNDDRLGRVLDKLFLAGLSSCFMSIAMKAVAKFGVTIETAHLDSTSFHLHGEYETANEIEVVVTQNTEDGTRVEIEVAPKGIHPIKQLQKLSAQEFSCEPDAIKAAMQFSSQLKYHTLEALSIIEQDHYSRPGRPGKKNQSTHKTYHIQATLVLNVRHALVQADESLPNQLKKPTRRPTLRWIFQCFQAVHLLVIDGVKQITNLTDERVRVLRFFSQACRDYYLLC